jgi:RNA polymerase sigma factor (sigma-70 family)
MEQQSKLVLLGEDGKLLDDRIVATLSKLVSRFRNHFPTLQDEVWVTEIFERAGWRIAKHERECGPLEKPYGYAWAAIRSHAISLLRGGSIEFHRNRAETHAGPQLLSRLRALDGSPDSVERQILLGELRAQLTPYEERVFAAKMAGYSSQEIARLLHTSAGAIDVVVTRLRRKLREFVLASR